MSQIPDPISLTTETNEGYVKYKSDQELLQEMIAGFNQLVIYLDSISERL